MCEKCVEHLKEMGFGVDEFLNDLGPVLLERLEAGELVSGHMHLNIKTQKIDFQIGEFCLDFATADGAISTDELEASISNFCQTLVMAAMDSMPKEPFKTHIEATPVCSLNDYRILYFSMVKGIPDKDKTQSADEAGTCPKLLH